MMKGLVFGTWIRSLYVPGWIWIVQGVVLFSGIESIADWMDLKGPSAETLMSSARAVNEQRSAKPQAVRRRAITCFRFGISISDIPSAPHRPSIRTIHIR